jgi:hypothetical protein
VIALVLLPVFFAAGFLEARRFERVYGRSPWGLSPALWGAALGLVFLLALPLLAIAERQGRGKPKTPAALPTVTQSALPATQNILPHS